MLRRENDKNATCIICGKKYHLCIACERTKSTWRNWKIIADSENCYEVYKIVNDYNFNKISKDEAKSLLEKCDLAELETFKDNVKNVIKEIMETKSVSKTVKATKTKEENKQ